MPRCQHRGVGQTRPMTENGVRTEPPQDVVDERVARGAGHRRVDREVLRDGRFPAGEGIAQIRHRSVDDPPVDLGASPGRERGGLALEGETQLHDVAGRAGEGRRARSLLTARRDNGGDVGAATLKGLHQSLGPQLGDRLPDDRPGHGEVPAQLGLRRNAFPGAEIALGDALLQVVRQSVPEAARIGAGQCCHRGLPGGRVSCAGYRGRGRRSVRPRPAAPGRRHRVPSSRLSTVQARNRSDNVTPSPGRSETIMRPSSIRMCSLKSGSSQSKCSTQGSRG